MASALAAVFASRPTPRSVASSGGPCCRRHRRLSAFAAARDRQPSASHGLSFRTTEESLRDAFERFGELTEVHLVMDRVAKRPRGFAFLSYASDKESKNAMEVMHGKFLDGRVIFVETAKPRSELEL
ncbi:hypothetical protein GUJ93_ZPchr0013g37833 [Zizania palustris]|uniref:RRM domain-containing protein n=1 Tax=Zizania palustris TaxID=103762 RepID=A0A8J5X272_ZIZPA|nr:hypothetical protein GUJ93_ZPchr0013g37833 [Zizania palustris]